MRTHPLFAAAALTLVASQAQAQGEFTFNVNQSLSAWNWTANTSLGAMIGIPDNTFESAGTVDMNVEEGADPISSASYESAIVATVPAQLHGQIPNPIPIFPPLADVYIDNMVLSWTSPTFSVAADGSFTTDIVTTVISGDLTIVPLVGSTTVTPLAGTVSDPNPISGFVTSSGGSLHFDYDSTSVFVFDDPGSGLSATFTLTGRIDADADCPGATNYCSTNANSSGGPAVISLAGSSSLSANNWVLEAAPVPNNWGIFFYGGNQVAGGNGIPFGDGRLCVGAGQVFRGSPRLASGNVHSYDIGVQNPPSTNGTIHVGTEWHFQAWFRDPQGSGGSGFNLSNGLTVQACP
ncbi:MAG TPA: hypothetical protein QF730_03470 [Planctomycetota bacterium]|jgi:hypothetical protein|nr:hypothetical protein [Planctomycetota bacterium]